MSDHANLHYPIPHDVSLLPVIRALYETHGKVERVASHHIESMGLTPSQFDVLVTLGDHPGMTCKQLGQQALITSGTLTPVLDRMASRGLVQRTKSEQDSRQTIVSLTPEGQQLYEQTFLPHVVHMRGHVDQLSAEDQAQLVTLLHKLAAAFSAAPPKP